MTVFNTDRTTLILKPEPIRGTYSNPAQVDHNLFVQDISVETDIEMMPMKFATGFHEESAAIPGARMGKVSFSVPLNISTNLANAVSPAWSKVFSNGYGCHVATTSGQCSVSPHVSADENTSSILVQLQQASGNTVSYQFAGCIGTDGEFMFDKIGQPFMFKASFIGAMTSATEPTVVPRATTLDSASAPGVIGASMTALGVAKRVSKFSLKLGVKSELEPDLTSQSGYLGGYIASRQARIEIDPMASLLSTDNFWSNLINETTGAFSATSRAIGTVKNTIAAPKIQLIENKPGDKSGSQVNNQTWIILSDTGNNGWSLTQA
jgi:hypothetical protein